MSFVNVCEAPCTSEEEIDANENFDDEFGDFEKATTSFQTFQNENASDVQNELFSEQLSHSESIDNTFELPNDYRLIEILEDVRLWSMDDEYHKSSLKNVNNEVEICDILNEFNFCDELDFETRIVNENVSKSIYLWSNLCYIEETAALKFLWDKSLTQGIFFNALNINAQKINKQECDISSSEEIEKYISLPSSSKIESSEAAAVETNLETALTFTNTSEVVDSLSVPPVTFDWQSSGLSNPLTGSSMPAISAVLECDFFTTDNLHDAKCNGQSILERDLDALGLNEKLSSTITKEKHIKNMEEFIHKCRINETLDNFSNTKLNADIQQYNNSIKKPIITFKNVDELSSDTLILYNRLPDHSYMLATRLVFPIRNDE